ncbi:proteophosphoglycan ppg4 [Gigaspora margarita]|uniref:Proteophosphoglycan ppg4 n=1 Tax=Gigaspora margarita TaxID=4874 RepID=A0A8H3XCZ6_GIGMA|nr:proteophosphoglycan ppg4 [Gigaspora margarita]
MHKCSVRIITKVMLSEVDTDYPVRLIIEGNHVLQNVIQEITIPSQINLSRENSICDDVKLCQFIERDNSHTRSQVGPWTTVYELVNSVLKEKGVVLYYQQADINASEDSSNHYYQLTLSNDLWLEQARDFGSFALVSMAKLSTGLEFMRILNCAPVWRPFAVIDKHQPTKRGLQHILRGVILCWFHIMQTLGEHLKNLRIDNHYRYPIAIAFKIVGQSRDKEEALKLGKAYQSFIKFLPLTEIAKESLCNDIFANWLSEVFLFYYINDRPGIKPMTMNNLKERMNKSIEAQCIGFQPINCFIEKLYGITLVQNNIIKEASSQLIFEAGQNGSFHDVCKHVYAAHLFNDIETNKIAPDVIKHDLVLHFHNKEHAMPNELKNNIIYNNSDDIVFKEILQIYLNRNFLADNVPMLLDEVELSNIFEPKETSASNMREVLHPLALSVQKRLTTAIHNYKYSISNKVNFNIIILDK